MSEYTNTHILECSRLHSAESGDINTDNTSVWTNDVNSGLNLDIGDTISLHSAFISDLGAEDSTIEFSGKVVQNQQVFEVSKVLNYESVVYDTITNNASLLQPRYYVESEISSSSITINSIKDTDANILVSYYKSNNGEHMFHLPLKFANPIDYNSIKADESWTLTRDQKKHISGMAYPVSASHRFAGDYTFDTTDTISQINVDGSRYMIFGRDITYFIQKVGIAGATKPMYGRDLFSVNNKYIRIKDLLELNVPRGFNSPSDISDVITEQLQEQSKIIQSRINYELSGEIVQRPIGITNETPTNKLFNSATAHSLNKTQADAFYGIDKTMPLESQLVLDYQMGYQYLGIKRPELYENGIEIKIIDKHIPPAQAKKLPRDNALTLWDAKLPHFTFSASYSPESDNEIDYGAMESSNTLMYDYYNELPFGMTGKNDNVEIVSLIHTNYIWNETNLTKFKTFFDSQKRFPELFDMNSDRCGLLYNKTLYNASEYAGEEISLDTHRFLHMGSRVNSAMPFEIYTNGDSVSPELNPNYISFGYDNIPSIMSASGVDNGSPVNTSGTDFSSVPLFIKYFDEFKDNISNTDKFTYGVDKSNGANSWGGFAVRSPPTKEIVEDSGAFSIKDMTYNLEYNASYGLKDRISFLAVVPKKYTTSVKLTTLHNADGSASSTPQLHFVNTLGQIDWYTDVYSLSLPLTHINVSDMNAIKIGYDQHPTAYGNAYIGLYNGISGGRGISYDDNMVTAIDTKNPLTYVNQASASITQTVAPLFTERWLDKVYCGAIAPELSFDTVTSRFALSSLHSPERITSKYDATFTMKATSGPSASLSEGQVIPVPDDNGKECYKINKIFDKRNYCPTITPYTSPLGIEIVNTVTDLFSLPLINTIIKRDSVIDSNSGIFIEDFNILEKNWSSSFWGICGFSYSNLNNSNTGNINEKIFNNQLGTIAKLATNANVENSDLLLWNGAGTGVPANTYSLNQQKVFLLVDTTTKLGATEMISQPPMEVLCDSAKIEASNLPTKTLRPFFTVRSDIIGDSYYNGGRQQKSAMPVLAVIPKESQYGDFYYGNDNTIFTLTYPKTITRITTQICDPNGDPSNLSPNSCVLYKITKVKQSNANILQEVLKANK